MGGISIWQLLIILGIVVVLFGTNKLRNIGSDLGGAVKGFKKAMSDEDNDSSHDQGGRLEDHKSETIDGKAEQVSGHREEKQH